MTWCSLRIALFRSLWVKAHSQLTTGFLAVYQTVHPGSWFAFFEFDDDPFRLYVTQLAFYVFTQAQWNASLSMDNSGSLIDL